ncbi:MAG: phenylalanine--tRNA ligase subunit alpha [Rhodospirillaceae bacterium]|nr:phenylalanine--tRNA ligase subunit alpha [Rhodospirillaceae bacterium]
MQHELSSLRETVVSEVESVSNLTDLEAIRVATLGKKGRLTLLMKSLSNLSDDERRSAGTILNKIKNEIIALIDVRKTQFELEVINLKLAEESIDVTLPSRIRSKGFIHPISQVIEEMITIFGEMNFEIASGPEIEEDFYNFTALNIPPEHPARQMHDTFYLTKREGSEQKLLRTHTSPVQIRTMIGGCPPFRIIAPGRTYRHDYDMTHTPMFHQIEGLVIDDGTHFGHLKGCLADFVRLFFEVDDLNVRFRPSYFPFTEPSAEMDIGCSRKSGQLRLGGDEDWMEILGCGMVHPRVLQASGVDSHRFQGFAFGVGVERAAMLKYGIPDLRSFFDSDIRWLKHYGFGSLDIPSFLSGVTR